MSDSQPNPSEPSTSTGRRRKAKPPVAKQNATPKAKKPKTTQSQRMYQFNEWQLNLIFFSTESYSSFDLLSQFFPLHIHQLFTRLIFDAFYEYFNHMKRVSILTFSLIKWVNLQVDSLKPGLLFSERKETKNSLQSSTKDILDWAS